MEGKDCKLMDEVKEVAAVIKDTVSCVQKSVKNLARVHGMEEALKQVARVHDELDKKERDALQTMITAYSQVGLAVHFARVAVRTCKSIVETVRRVITADNGKMNLKLEHAINIFVHRGKTLIPQLEKVRDEIAQFQVVLKEAIGGFEILKQWYYRKISEMKGKAESKVVTQQAISYGGAAAAATGVGKWLLVVNWWNPFGGAATVAGGVAVGVTEGITVPDLEKQYDFGIKSLNEATELFEYIYGNIEDNICELKKKTKLMTEIVEMAEQIVPSEEMIKTFDEEGFSVKMFNIFKEDVSNLDKLCDDYLNAPDLFRRDHQEEETKA